jgi:thiamine pyrophosphokinase
MTGIYHSAIVANAPDFDAAPFRSLLEQVDLLIAADGGANALFQIDLLPQLVIGDLDSLSSETRLWLEANHVEIQRFPAEKDETDLELALLLAAQRGAERITVLAAFGGRWDQSLANMALLALPELEHRDVRLVDQTQQAFLISGERTIEGTVGDTLSLLPLGGFAHGVSTHGLYYPLYEASLHYARARGISNVIIEMPAKVTVREGLLLAVHTPQE